VIAPPAPPVITSAADALAVVLNERGRVDLDHIAELLHRDPTTSSPNLAARSSAIPPTAPGRWPTPISRAMSATS
jgi:N12 class adenine-specific DNA methylase